jgi:hypothetical protein
LLAELIAFTIGIVATLIGAAIWEFFRRHDEWPRRKINEKYLGRYYGCRLHTDSETIVRFQLDIYRHYIFGYKYRWHSIVGRNLIVSHDIFSGSVRFIDDKVVINGDQFSACFSNNVYGSNLQACIGVFGGVREKGRLPYAGLIILSRIPIKSDAHVKSILCSSQQHPILYLDETRLDPVAEAILRVDQLSTSDKTSNSRKAQLV